MVFKAEPNLYVKLSNKYVQRSTGLKGFYFDDKGEYETENPLMIKVLSQNFSIVDEIEDTAKEISEEKPKKQCKKCEFTCENQGELLAHYKTIHPKEG